MTATHTLTQLLKDWNAGDQTALAQLAPCVDSELRRLAGVYMRQQQPGHLLQTTALVNEAWVHLIEWREVSWQNRAHFFGLAAQVMRNILVDEARRRQAQKHGGDLLRVSLSDAAHVALRHTPDLVALDDALRDLARFDERRSRIVEMRFFAGLSVEETAEVLQVSPRTVAREWRLAQAWLYQQLNCA